MPESAISAGLHQGLHLEERDLKLVREILREHIPEQAVWAFGSRATGGRMLKRFSDLDLAVEGELTWKQRVALREAFEESLLPIKVDVVELGLVEADFRERIERDFVAVQTAGLVCSKPMSQNRDMGTRLSGGLRCGPLA